MKISEFENEEAIDLLADIIEPLSVIFTDAEIKTAVKSDSKMVIIQKMLKNHKKEIIQVLARMHNTPIEEYKCNIATITVDLLELLNDKELAEVFH